MHDGTPTLKKKIGTIAAWTVGIIATLAVLVLVAKLQDAPKSGSSLTSEITNDDRQTGKLDSAVTLLEYSDFQCPACASYAPLIEKLMTEYSDKIRFVYRHFPIYTKHPNAEISARAAEAAGEQGKFFEFGSLLFARQNEWAQLKNPQDKLLEYAKALDLNEDEFKKYMNSKESKTAVTKDYQGGVKAGVDSTPSFFLNGKSIVAPRSYDALKKMIDEALSAAAAPTPTPTTDAASQPE